MVGLREFLAERLGGVPRELLPSRARLIDGVALVRFPDGLETWEREIGELVLRFYGRRVRGVYRWIGVEGVERRPVLRHLAGERVRVVEHREYGWRLRFDLERLMLCLGNSYERLRVARLVKPGEVVLDMFAGVGQFTIPVAVLASPKKVYAVEINPEAYRYLVENIALNRVEGKVEAFLGDCRKVVEERFKGVADRVIMGYLGGTLGALPQALGALRSMGGVIHFHELARRGGEERFVEEVREGVEELGYEARVLGWRKVKSYSRTRNHVVIDLWAARRDEA